ncbi:uncharacterized protein LOC120007790 [Tripterygium wilfordii]|uniref:uncharacterized protein LOC120007790 n=1 Tax=Tripterygium wilfordii TaxID=458696 RepID=UPI0018F84D2B|nr:uncharacterized protein LOC120007790 [Tripterygium wilfordii]
MIFCQVSTQCINVLSCLGISGKGLIDHGQALSVSMTATMDTVGIHVLGVVSNSLGSALRWMILLLDIYGSGLQGSFQFPQLKEVSDFTLRRKVRIGLHLYVPDGKPMIGPLWCAWFVKYTHCYWTMKVADSQWLWGPLKRLRTWCWANWKC